jgi:hypothetical protein
VTARARGRVDEHLVGVPRVGDLVGRGAVEIGDYPIARMGPAEFERFIASVGSADRVVASPVRETGRRMSDRTTDPGASPTGPTG